MNDKRKSNFGPAQLDRLLGQITDRINSSSDENQTICTQVHDWLHSSLDDRSILPDSLKEPLSVFDKTIVAKSLIELLLAENTQPTVLKTLAYCAQEYSLNVTKPSENALALIVYYAALASLLVFHGQQSEEHSLESLLESFTDLKVKPWMLSELRSHIDRACQICRKKQTRNNDEKGRGHSPSGNAEVDLGRWVEGVGARIGCYRLLKILGEGGMGIVYLAEQEQLIRRRVALKIIKPGMDSKRVLARFEAERQALALLDHPNIAQVHDAGTSDSGRPYFVMEYVKGTPITEFCDRHTLSIEERLRMFQQVCTAIHHAHQKGIIHRDIKPSNILVTSENDQVISKIIDFGVAKALVQPLTERTLITEESQLLGTPEYMSPEQVELANEDIDTRSDIYSLGVLLYELLTGVLPFDPDTLRTGGIEHIRQIIRETDPKTPSTRLTKLGDEAKKVAENRQTEIGTLTKRLHQELEWIPLKAMRKERSDRYRSASELSDDIENYLKGAPLMAGPLTAGYRLRKFLRRHKALVGGVAAVLVVSIIGTIVSVVFALGQSQARAESQTITNFLTEDVLSSVEKIKGREATVADILGAATKSLEGRFKDQPRAEADICRRLGMMYRILGDHRAAIPHLTRSYQIRREQFGEYNRLTMGTKNYLALEYKEAGEYKEAERLLSELIKGMDPQNVRNLPTRKCNLATIYLRQGRYEEAERLLVEVLSSETTEWWEWWSPWVKPYMDYLAEIYLYQGRYKEAEQQFDQFINDLGDGALRHITISRLGYLYMAQERYEEAADLFTRGIEYCKRELPGKDHPTTLAYMNGLAVLRTKQKQYEEAERLFHEALETRKLKLGDDHPDTLESKNDLAVLYKEQGDYAKAEPLFLEALEGRRLKLSDTHPHTLESLQNLIELYEAWKKPEKAAEWRAKLPD